MKIKKSQLEKLIKEAIEANLSEDTVDDHMRHDPVQELVDRYETTILNMMEDGEHGRAMKLIKGVIRNAYQAGKDVMENTMYRQHKRGELDDDDDVLDDDKPGFFKKKFGIPDNF